MKYRELLQLYRDGKLDEDKREEVEQDIEKQDAISEYLFENTEIPGIDEVAGEDIDFHSEADEFTKIINRKIRGAFIKAGVYAAIASAVIVLFALFALPKIVDLFYYNPCEVLGEQQPDSEYLDSTTRFELDLKVYAEAFLPMRSVNQASAVSIGNGKYIINYLADGSFAGTIDKNRIVLYDPDSLKNSINDWNIGNSEGKAELVIESPKGVIYDVDAVNDLKDDGKYNASVTFNRCMRYDDFLNWCKQNDINPRWCAYSTFVRDADPEKLPIGYYSEDKEEGTFSPGIGCMGFNLCEGYYSYYDKEKYPLLASGDAMDASKEETIDYEAAVQHVKSMLTYLEDNPELCDMLETGTWFAHEYVRKHIDAYGLYIYGFVISDYTGRELKQLSELEEVNYVMADPE